MNSTSCAGCLAVTSLLNYALIPSFHYAVLSLHSFRCCIPTLPSGAVFWAESFLVFLGVYRYLHTAVCSASVVLRCRVIYTQ